ncbi:hypothetical protein SPONN_1250 [uncultured Candidatus Thioglobus sp.]|nr:hypothetical protein SPONN_1250 [uncultured Candidatus Thioglobus sp.]
MEYGSFIANTLGVANEIQGANPENERNMDNWNNSVGRDADQVGDDTIHGGSGNDLIIGFTGSNEAKQTLDAGESDDDTIYGWEKVA